MFLNFVMCPPDTPDQIHYFARYCPIKKSLTKSNEISELSKTLEGQRDFEQIETVYTPENNLTK